MIKRDQEVYGLFAESDYGESLKGVPRWDRYRPEHISPKEWIDILGNDADNLKHMQVAYKITRVFINRDDGSLDIDQDEANLLTRAAIIHDWGESYDPETGDGGDVNYELKTIDDTLSERERFDIIFDTLLPEEDVKIKHILRSIIFDSNETKLGKIFNAVERIGYLRTAHRALEESLKTSDQVLQQHLQWLTAGVLSNQIMPLIEYSASYTPVRKYLSAIAPFIDKAYQTINPNIFVENGQTEKNRQELYKQSMTAWQHGLFHRTPRTENEKSTIFDNNSSYERRFIDNYDELTDKIEACRTLGMKIVLTSGSFDLLHIGHMKYIEKASSFGDILIVGVDSDEKIRERKGPTRPVVSEDERVRMLSHVRSVGFITLKRHTDEKWELIKKVKPDVLIATAETYNDKEITELEEEYCGEVIVLEPQAVTSTSARIRRLTIDSYGRLVEKIIEAVENGEPVDAIRQVARTAIENA